MTFHTFQFKSLRLQKVKVNPAFDTDALLVAHESLLPIFHGLLPSEQFLGLLPPSHRLGDSRIELETKVREDFTITEKAPTMASSWLKLLRHLAKQVI